MIEGLAAEGRKLADNARRIEPRLHGEIGTTEMRRAAQRRGKIGDEREMRHLVDGDGDELSVPTRDDARFVRREKRIWPTFQAEGGVEIAAHEVVLDLRCLGEEVEK